MADDLQPRLRRKAMTLLRPLPAAEREALLIKSWMAHDARWFIAASRACGMDVSNELNRTAAHELGRAEAPRLAEALGVVDLRTLDDWLVLQETFITLLGPNLLDYTVTRVGPQTYEIEVAHCFALDNAVRAGVASRYDCAFFERVRGWLEGLGFACEITPTLGRCQKVQNRACRYTITVRRADDTMGSPYHGLSG